MKVFHINSNYGFTYLHQKMIEKLDLTECENQIFMPKSKDANIVVTPNENVSIIDTFNKYDRLFFGYKQRKIFNKAKKFFDLTLYDIIHAYTLFTDGNTANRLSKKYNKPYVVAIRDTDVNTFFRFMPHLRKRGIKIMREASSVFFLSETYRKQVFEKYIPYKYQKEIKEKSYIIPNGIDDFWLENIPGNNKTLGEKIKFIHVGRINKIKNVTTTQKAIAILKEKGYNVSFTAIGKIENKKEFNKICKDKNTKYIPAVPKEELINLYRAHDIFVMPSHTETFGLVYAEAMSQGLPVIYTKGQGFDGQFEEGCVGFHVNSRDAFSIAKGIEKVIESYDSISGNVVKASQKFNWTKITDKYLQIYKSIMAGEKNNAE